ncbi:MAG: BrnA antitoxin family protein [Actinomycetia bacterium]|nr:BrnA antitoxin family protein [Actinomycetes bacterium]
MNKKPLTDKHGEVRELTREDMRLFRTAAEVLPEILGPKLGAELLSRKPGQRGPQKTPRKEPVTVRYSREVIEYFRSTGRGWQSRMDSALKEWVDAHR